MAQAQKIRSGIPGLDDLTEGGFWPKTTIVILGSSGTGKATVAAHVLLEGVEQGEQALYVSLEEPPEQIMPELLLDHILEVLAFEVDEEKRPRVVLPHVEA